MQRDCTRAIFLALVLYLAVFDKRNVVSSHMNLLYSFQSLISPGLRPYSLSEGVAIGNATTGGGCIDEGTQCGGFVVDKVGYLFSSVNSPGANDIEGPISS